MRYLIFNIAVFVALAYLVVGPDQAGPGRSSQPIAQESVAPQTVEKEAPRRVAEKKAPAPAPRPILTERSKESEPDQSVETVKTAKAPPPLSKAIEVAKVEPKATPSRATQTVQEDGVVEPVPPASKQETVLVDAKERSKQLREMVADMERMFAEKMTR